MRKDVDSHGKHIGKTQTTEEKKKERKRTEKVRERRKKNNSRDEGEKTANWQVRRCTTLLDWTGLESNTHQAGKVE